MAKNRRRMRKIDIDVDSVDKIRESFASRVVEDVIEASKANKDTFCGMSAIMLDGGEVRIETSAWKTSHAVIVCTVAGLVEGVARRLGINKTALLADVTRVVLSRMKRDDT